jgi:hypothetical protein
VLKKEEKVEIEVKEEEVKPKKATKKEEVEVKEEKIEETK